MEKRQLMLRTTGQPCVEFLAKERKRKKPAASTSTRKKKKAPKPSSPVEVQHVEAGQEASPGECQTYRSNLDVGLAYINLLVTQRAVAPVDPHKAAFVMQQLDNKTMLLKDDFVIIKRNPTKVPEGHIWLYSCSCNPARESLVDSMSDTLADSFEELTHPYAKCDHIKAMEQLSSSLDTDVDIQTEYQRRKTDSDEIDHSYEMPVSKVDLYGLEAHEHVVVVRFETQGLRPTFSIVKIDFKGPKPILKCSSCPRQESTCRHAQAILKPEYGTLDVCEALKELLNRAPKWRSRYIPVAVSSKPIPFSPLGKSRKNNCHLQDKEGMVNLIPDADDCCQCGGEWLEEVFLEKTHVVSMCEIIPANVYIRHCQKCNDIKEYEGLHDGYLNMGAYLVSHDIFQKYARQFVTEGSTMINFYRELCWEHIGQGNHEITTLFPYYRFRYSWYAFLNLLDADYEIGFSCPKCGHHPETVVMDGVALGMRKQFMPWKKAPDPKKKEVPIFDGSSHNTRVFINNARTRHLLAVFSKSELTEGQFEELLTGIRQYQPALTNLLVTMESTLAILQCPQQFQDLLLSLSSNYPVCSLLHPNENLFDVLEQVSHGADISSKVSATSLVQLQCPVLAAVLTKMKWRAPDFLCPIIKEMIQKAKKPFAIEAHNTGICMDECRCTGHSLFPCLPKIAHRGDYVLDQKKSQAATGCRKKGFGHPSLTPGIFTMSCIHGICYGFQQMEDMESPNIAFSNLRSRFLTAPKLIIYDNACNLHNYCLNRDPGFFKNSWFVVDRFHWINHVGCHQGYNLTRYLQHAAINTQVAEQRNATLKKLKSMLSYMNLDNFNMHLKLFLWFRSMLSLVKIDGNIQSKDAALFQNLLPLYTKFHSAGHSGIIAEMMKAAGPGLDVIRDSGAFPCAVCRDGVGSSNAIKCSQCKLWVHERFSGIQGRTVANPNYVCPRCQGQTRPIDGRPVTQVDVDGTMLDVEASFCYLGDMMSAGGSCSLAIITRCCTAWGGDSSRSSCQS